MIRKPILELIDGPISGEWGSEPGTNPVKVLRTTNFTNDGSLNLTDVVLREIPDRKVAAKKLHKGDIIIEKSGGSPNQPVGRVVFFEEEGTYLCNNFTSIIRPKAQVHSKYLFYILFGGHISKTTLRYQNKTTGIINLQLERYLKELTIPFPPLSEQIRIAEVLDKADALRRQDRLLLEKYDQLLQSVFLDMFGDPVKNKKGWEVKSIGELSSFITSGSRGWAKYYSDEGDVFLRIQNIGYNQLKLDDLTFVQTPFTAEAKRTKVQPGDLIFSITADLGRTAVIPANFPNAYINQHLSIIRFKSSVNPIYVSSYFSSTAGRLQVERSNKGGVKAGLNFDDIRTMTFLLPPLSLQNRYAEIVEKVEAQKALVRQSMKKSEELFQSLLQRAFRGELRLKDLAAQPMAMAAEPVAPYSGTEV